MKKSLLLFLGIFIIYSLSAKDIKGTVYGLSTTNTKETLPFATIYWADASTGVTSNEDGAFSIAEPKKFPAKLVASFVGYNPDTITITSANNNVEFTLHVASNTLDNVVVVGRRAANYISKLAPVKTEVISAAGLCKMACCNLAESFENSASISVGYSDAVSGARQIRLLGLSGIYTQMLDENRPDMRGLATPFGLSYTPGQWLESIQVAKGMGSVLQGYESITGQINLEYRKPTTPEPFFINLFVDDMWRTEANIASSLQLSPKWYTTILAHGSIDTKKHDGNDDGFLDEPLKKQINIANRWLYTADNGAQLRLGIKGLYEERESGQMDFDKNRPRDITQYGTEIDNKHFNAYVKLGIPVGKPHVHEEGEEEHEEEAMQPNIAFMADYSFHELNSFFGLKDYNGKENTASLNVLFQSGFGKNHRYTLGASGRWNNFKEQLQDVWFTSSNARKDSITNLDREEWVAGVFGEYTFSYDDKLTLVAGMRADYNSLYKWLFTPRVTVKYNFTEQLILRMTGGRGFRAANVITDNIGMLATGRQIYIDNNLDIEDAWTYGGSFSWYFKLFQDENASISVDYFRTEFTNQILVDQERDPSKVWIYNLDGKSYSNTYQIDFSVAPFERFTAMATFRYTDAKSSYKTNTPVNELRERPLTDRYKAVLNLQYATRMNIWTFDFTAQVNGETRLPDFAVTHDNYSPVYPLFFAQITRKFKGVDIYLGCENLFNYMQHDPIINAHDPYDQKFNSSVIWGPLMGRKIYAGLRFTLFN